MMRQGLNEWSSPGGGMPTGGSNQWMNFPALPNFSANPQNMSDGFAGGGGKPGQYFEGSPGGKHDLGGNIFTAPTFDPAFTGQFFNMISQLMRGGGGDLQNQLLSFLSGGKSSIPGASSLSSMAQTGNPISALPEWQKMIDAQQRNIGENAANLKEQFAFAGNLSSTPMGNAMGDFFSQTAKDQNALLGQLDTAAMENAMQRELSASSTITGMAGAETQFLDSLFSGAATASPGLFEKHKGSLLGGIGSLLSGAAGGLSTLEDAGLSLGFLGL